MVDMVDMVDNMAMVDNVNIVDSMELDSIDMVNIGPFTKFDSTYIRFLLVSFIFLNLAWH